MVGCTKACRPLVVGCEAQDITMGSYPGWWWYLVVGWWWSGWWWGGGGGGGADRGGGGSVGLCTTTFI